MTLTSETKMCHSFNDDVTMHKTKHVRAMGVPWCTDSVAQQNWGVLDVSIVHRPLQPRNEWQIKSFKDVFGLNSRQALDDLRPSLLGWTRSGLHHLLSWNLNRALNQ